MAYDDLDREVIRVTQGDLPVVPEPYVDAANELGMSVDALLTHLRGMQERGILRRVAAILYHRRAGFSANGMGVWEVPDDQIADLGPKMAAYRGISHCYQRPTYEDAVPGRVLTVDRGRMQVLLFEGTPEERDVPATRARELGKAGVVTGDAVDVGTGKVVFVEGLEASGALDTLADHVDGADQLAALGGVVGEDQGQVELT